LQIHTWIPNKKKLSYVTRLLHTLRFFKVYERKVFKKWNNLHNSVSVLCCSAKTVKKIKFLKNDKV
jgi:hypothetical protein